jgi:hypothetical protein
MQDARLGFMSGWCSQRPFTPWRLVPPSLVKVLGARSKISETGERLGNAV